MKNKPSLIDVQLHFSRLHLPEGRDKSSSLPDGKLMSLFLAVSGAPFDSVNSSDYFFSIAI